MGDENKDVLIPTDGLPCAGVSLRSYFAIHALAGILATGDGVAYAVEQAVDAADRLMEKLKEGSE